MHADIAPFQLKLLAYNSPQAYSPLGPTNSPLLTDDVVQIADSDVIFVCLFLLLTYRDNYRDNNRIHLILVAKGIIVASQSCQVCPYYVQFYGGALSLPRTSLRFDVTDLQTLDRVGCKW